MLRTHFSVFFTAFLIYSAFIIGAGIHFSLAPYGFWFIVAAALLFIYYLAFSGKYYSRTEYYKKKKKPIDVWVKFDGAYITGSLISCLILLASISIILVPMVVEKSGNNVDVAWYYYVLLFMAAILMLVLFIPVINKAIGENAHSSKLEALELAKYKAKQIVERALQEVKGVSWRDIMPYYRYRDEFKCTDQDLFRILCVYRRHINTPRKKYAGMFITYDANEAYFYFKELEVYFKQYAP